MINAKICKNEYDLEDWQLYDAKWVLVLNEDKVKEGFCFKETGTIMWAGRTKKDLIEIYSKGIVQENYDYEYIK